MPNEFEFLFQRTRNELSADLNLRRHEELAMEEEDNEALRESISVFLLQLLKKSPKNMKKSKFRANLKAAVKACDSESLDPFSFL